MAYLTAERGAAGSAKRWVADGGADSGTGWCCRYRAGCPAGYQAVRAAPSHGSRGPAASGRGAGREANGWADPRVRAGGLRQDRVAGRLDPARKPADWVAVAGRG